MKNPRSWTGGFYLICGMNMKKTFFMPGLIGLILLAANGYGQGPDNLKGYGLAKEIFRIWPASVSCQGAGVKRPPAVSPDHSNNVKRLSEVTDPVLEVFP